MMRSETGREEFLRLAGGLYDQVVSRADSKSDDTLDDIEQQAEKAGREVALRLLAQRLAAEEKVHEQHTVLCPQCGKPMRRATEPSVRHLDTASGTVRYGRCHAICDRCRSSFSPSRQPAGDPPSGRVEPPQTQGL